MKIFQALQLSFLEPLYSVLAKGVAFFRSFRVGLLCAASFLVVMLTAIVAVSGQRVSLNSFIPNGVFFGNPGGASQTYSTANGGIDPTGPFFQSIGTNGRSCGSCHQPSDGMSVSAAHVQARFDLSEGLDPIFRTVDGSNCNHSITVSTLEGRKAAYSAAHARFDPHSHRRSGKRRLLH